MRVRESEREIDRGNESKREREKEREREIEREKEGHLWSPPSFSSPCFLLPVTSRPNFPTTLLPFPPSSHHTIVHANISTAVLTNGSL